MAKQLNIFLENRPGRLKSVTEALSDKKINIIAFTIQDRGDFGLMKLIVDNPQDAYLALSETGYACALKNTLLICIKDKPGNLNKLSSILLKHKINIIDAHGFAISSSKQGVCSLEVNERDFTKASKVLEKEGFKVLTEKESCRI